MTIRTLPFAIGFLCTVNISFVIIAQIQIQNPVAEGKMRSSCMYTWTMHIGIPYTQCGTEQNFEIFVHYFVRNFTFTCPYNGYNNDPLKNQLKHKHHNECNNWTVKSLCISHNLPYHIAIAVMSPQNHLSYLESSYGSTIFSLVSDAYERNDKTFWFLLSDDMCNH